MVVGLLTALDASAAEPFTGSRLFVNHSMKHDVGRTFGIGINVSVAPVKAAQQKLVEEFSKQPNAEVILEAAQYVDPDEIRNLSASELRETLKNAADFTDAEKAEIDAAFSGISDGDTQLVADLIEIMQDKDTAIAFSLEPYFELHLDVMDLFFYVPLAGFVEENSTDFALGNMGVDFRFGESWGESVQGGISGGLQLWAPTGSGKAGALGLANLLWSPKYFHQFLTVGPYVVAGGDFRFVQIQAHVAYNMMFGVRDNPIHDNVHYLHWGASFAITAIPFIVISSEISGLANAWNAPAYDGVFLTAGLRVVASFLDIGIAAQVPLVQKDSSDFGGVSGVTFGSPSDYNILLTMAFGF